MNNQIKKINLKHSLIFFLFCNIFSLITFIINDFSVSPLICLLFISACAGKNTRNSNVPSEIVLEEVTREGLTTLSETVSLGPDSNYNNDVTKPRRELKTSINFNENKLVLKHNYIQNINDILKFLFQIKNHSE